MSETIDGWEVVAIEPGLWCLRRPGYSAEIQASADGDNIDIADDAGRRWLYPPVAAVERLLDLRRAALAPEDPLAVGVRSLVAGLDAIRAKALAPGAQAPSGEPWRPAVGEECLHYINGEWRLCQRVEGGEEGHWFVRVNGPDRLIHCPPTYDGVRPLGSLPVPPSCGGEIDPRERADRPAVASERPGLARLLEWARGAEREADAARDAGNRRDGAHHDGQAAYADCAREIEREIAAFGPPSIADAPSASVEPEWIVNDIAELGVRLNDRFFYLYKGGNISYEGGHDSGGPMRWRPVYKREFGEVCHPFGFKGLGDAERYELGDGWKDMPDLSTPPSIAEDLRTPEPGAFEGAVIVGVDLARGEDVSRVAAVVSREAVSGAVREALAELRGMLEDSADENHPLNPANAGLREAVEATDRFAERFKP